MKTKLLPVLFLLLALNGFSQSTTRLLSATQKLFTAHYEMDFETIVALSYPKMVETIGKDKMLEQLDQSYQNDIYRLRYQLESVPFVTRKIQQIGGLSFCVISCRNPVRYFFESPLTPEEVTAKTAWLKTVNRTENVVYEPKRNSFNVKRNTLFIAITDDAANGDWKFINWDEENQQTAFRTLFDEKTLTLLGLNK
ncbi:hypothetical protein [Flavobacterium sp. XGLA_31]|uniref:hypothetical protein n=1 Tax=Flavobacterium sp. XGLA_31 TaxID=3447666 RepID=UPI003F37D8A9